MSWPALAFPGLPWPSLAFLAPVLAPGHQRRKIVSVLNPPIIPPRQDRPRQKGQGRRQDGRDAAPATLIRAKARTAVLARPAQLGEAFQRAKTASASAAVFTGTASVSASACAGTASVSASAFAGTASVSASAFAGTASVSASAFAGTASLGPPRNFRRGVVQAPGARPSAPGAWRQAERARHLAPGRARQARPRASAAPCVPATRITRHVPAPRALRASRVRRHAQARAGTRRHAQARAHVPAHVRTQARTRARGRAGARARGRTGAKNPRLIGEKSPVPELGGLSRRPKPFRLMGAEFPRPESGGLSKSRREIFVLTSLGSAPASLNSLYRVALDGVLRIA